MLFNSYEFIFLLLPIALIGNWLLADNYQIRIAWLLACSLFFYAWWNPLHLPQLLVTIAFNCVVGARLRVGASKPLLVFGIAANLSFIGYYKYAEFFAENVANFNGGTSDLGQIALPLSILFFTFQQIAYLAV